MKKGRGPHFETGALGRLIIRQQTPQFAIRKFPPGGLLRRRAYLPLLARLPRNLGVLRALRIFIPILRTVRVPRIRTGRHLVGRYAAMAQRCVLLKLDAAQNRPKRGSAIRRQAVVESSRYSIPPFQLGHSPEMELYVSRRATICANSVVVLPSRIHLNCPGYAENCYPRVRRGNPYSQ